ncbi:MAG: hypothetical protein KKA28_00435 [Planctomycetes bacterium]|nr:hypothetical protein [Planctomycetota bacterium]MCG2683313.1 hypothetical protein [Planctomycetales bacterium]
MQKTFTLLALLALAVPAHAQQLLGKDKMFLRITNLRSDQSKVLIRVNVVPNHDKWFGWNGKEIYVGTNGENPDATVKPELWIPPNQSSPWVDIGQYMNLRGERSPDTYLSPVLCGIMTAPQVDGIHVLAEIATGRGTGVLRRLEIHKPEVTAKGKREHPWRIGSGAWNGEGGLLPTVGLLVPTRPDLAGRVYTLEEALRWQLESIQNLPKVGRTPEKFVFVAGGRPEVKKGLGYNGYTADTFVSSLGDEIGLNVAMPAEEQDKRFREALKSRKFDPLDLIADDQAPKAKGMPAEERWSLVHVLPPLPSKPKQFYESAIFRYQLWYDELAAQTRKAEKEHPHQRVLSGANYSPHMNVWPDVRQWVDPFRANAMTMSWTEDWWWQLPEVSPQGYGFLLDSLRLAGTYHGAPMQFYVMPFHGNSPDNFRRMSALATAHGVKIFNHFIIEDQTLITWDYVDLVLSANMFPAIHDVIRDAGATEHRLHPAMPARADVAILLSRASDTWDTEDLGGAGHLYGAKFNVNNDERKSLWLALRHAQYPVDLITDEDVAEGRLKGYKALYVVGSEMLAAAAKPLKQWVRDGGVVYATGGAGLLDEYHQPLASLYEMYGIKDHKLKREQRGIRPRRDLKAAKPLDTLHLAKSDLIAADLALPVLFYRQTVEPVAGATVLGKYQSDGTTGAVMNGFGKGRAVFVGALAGLTYLGPAATASSDVLPTAFPEPIREFLAVPARLAGAARPAVASNPLVETQYMTGPQGTVVTLINWNPEPIPELTLRFEPTLKVEKVRSLRGAGFFKGHLHEQDRGELEVKTIDGKQQVQFRLEVSDYLLIN